MKVLHVVESFGGGIVNFIQSLTTIDDSISHTILYNERELAINEIRPQFSDNITFIRWINAQRNIHPLRDLKALFFLKKIISNNKPDIVHLHSTKAGILGQLISRMFPKIKFIYTPNGASFARKDISKISYIIYIIIEKTANIIGVAKLVCVSKSELALFRNIGIRGTFINNGINVSKVKLESFKSNNPIVIVNSGRIATQKNPTLFNEIAELCKLNNLPVKFIWIGNGYAEGLLKSENIEITGWLGKNEVKKILDGASIFLSTSLWEGLSFAILEGMESNLALVCSRCIGNVDMVDDDNNGYLYDDAVEAFSIIQRYCMDNKLLSFHQKQSFEKVLNHFSSSNMKKEYLKLYIEFNN